MEIGLEKFENLWCIFKKDKGVELWLNKNKKWMQAVNLGSTFNTKLYEYCPYISPDLKYFFFSSESDVKWIDYHYLVQKINTLCKE